MKSSTRTARSIEVPGDLTTELVAEYAVDLGFSVTAQLPAANNAVDVQPGDGNFATIFPAAPAVGNPQRVRAVRARLSVRSREADREAAIPGGLYRFQLPRSRQPAGRACARSRRTSAFRTKRTC